jgi:gluconokinase
MTDDVQKIMAIVLIGVSASGKTTIAQALAKRIGFAEEDGDDYHPAANVAKMHAGIPLTDEDRWPWLAKVADWIRARTDAHRCGIITCSALKRAYRDLLRGTHVVFVYLAGERDLIAARLVARNGHFMPPALLASQFAALEPPGPDERAITVDVSASVTAEADRITVGLGLQASGATIQGRQP